MEKFLANAVVLSNDAIQSLMKINLSLKEAGVKPIKIENPIYACGACGMWSSGKGVCEGDGK